jgi:hypothetical protein
MELKAEGSYLINSASEYDEYIEINMGRFRP